MQWNMVILQDTIATEDQMDNGKVKMYNVLS